VGQAELDIAQRQAFGFVEMAGQRRRGQAIEQDPQQGLYRFGRGRAQCVAKADLIAAHGKQVFGHLCSLFGGHGAGIGAVGDGRDIAAQGGCPGLRRLSGSGGSGPGKMPLGLNLVDAPAFPDPWKPDATAGCNFLDLLRAETELDWTFLSPSAMFIPGERTCKFRLGTDLLLSNEHGSCISFEDYAVALVDEVESPAHSHKRFTVGY
jgi:hypothetical protein